LNIQKEINHFSELILNNPSPLMYYDDLHNLLIKNANKNEPLAKYIAHKIVIACCGKTHLYESLQFSNRKPVTELFEKYFSQLAIKNVNYAMRWKKFLYREYCLESSLPFCPTASCSECPSYSTCYTNY
jgi:nitrogen fixation protein NifQ